MPNAEAVVAMMKYNETFIDAILSHNDVADHRDYAARTDLCHQNGSQQPR